MNVIVSKDKHGPTIFASAVACVRSRINDYYQYDEYAAQLMAEAQDIVETGDERRARQLLDSRADWEYEDYYVTEVIE